MGPKRVIVMVVVCALSCGKAGKKEQSAECKRAADAAYQTWGAYLKALDRQQPLIEKKAEKFAPEGYPELAAASKVAIAEWNAATEVAKEYATRARFGKADEDGVVPGPAALEKARIAREKAEAAIERAFAARFQEGEDAIQRRKDALSPEKGKKLSAKRRLELEEKLVATQERVAKNNKLADNARKSLSERADAILELVEKAVAGDEETAALCAK